MKTLALIGIGGFAGAILRYLMSGWIQGFAGTSSFPLGTLGVNAIGCLLIGVLGGLADNADLPSQSARLLLVVGMLGSFTTFSTFGYDTLTLMRAGQFGTSFLNVVAQVLIGVTAVWAGYAVTLLAK